MGGEVWKKEIPALPIGLCVKEPASSGRLLQAAFCRRPHLPPGSLTSLMFGTICGRRGGRTQ